MVKDRVADLSELNHYETQHVNMSEVDSETLEKLQRQFYLSTIFTEAIPPVPTTPGTVSVERSNRVATRGHELNTCSEIVDGWVLLPQKTTDTTSE